MLAPDTPGVGPAVRPLLVREPIDTAALLAAVAADAAGANLLFLGTTRGVTDGVITRRLIYEAYEPLAVRVLERLRAEAVTRFGLTGCCVVHRLGTVDVGDASVAVAASAPHRRAVFAAVEWLMEGIKREAPIWKCEEAADGGCTWVHPGSHPEFEGRRKAGDA